MEIKDIMLLLCLNVIITTIYFIYKCIWKKQLKKEIILVLIMLIVPVIGIVYLICAEMVTRIFFKNKSDNLDAEALSFSKKRVRTIINDDVEKDADIVPIEEVMRISDSLDRRQSFLEVLKRNDVEDYTAGIQMAMKQGDAEVVHYAASYITDTIAKYKEGERKIRQLCIDTKDAAILEEYLHVCGNILNKHILNVQEQCVYLNYYDAHMEQLYEINKDKVNGNMMAQIINLHDEGNNQEGVLKWIKRVEEIIRYDLDAAKKVLTYYFNREDSTKFKAVLEDIKSSELVLDSETVEWIRFFS